VVGLKRIRGGGDSPGDNTVDYGNCSCAGVSGSSGPIILR